MRSAGVFWAVLVPAPSSTRGKVNPTAPIAHRANTCRSVSKHDVPIKTATIMRARVPREQGMRYLLSVLTVSPPADISPPPEAPYPIPASQSHPCDCAATDDNLSPGRTRKLRRICRRRTHLLRRGRAARGLRFAAADRGAPRGRHLVPLRQTCLLLQTRRGSRLAGYSGKSAMPQGHRP